MKKVSNKILMLFSLVLIILIAGGSLWLVLTKSNAKDMPSHFCAQNEQKIVDKILKFYDTTSVEHYYPGTKKAFIANPQIQSDIIDVSMPKSSIYCYSSLGLAYINNKVVVGTSELIGLSPANKRSFESMFYFRKAIDIIDSDFNLLQTTIPVELGKYPARYDGGQYFSIEAREYVGEVNYSGHLYATYKIDLLNHTFTKVIN